MTLRRALTLCLALAASAAGLGALEVGCSDRSRRGGVPTPSVQGVVLDYTDAFARDVPLEVASERVATRSGVGGLFALGPVGTGGRVLRVGDSVTTPTLLVPFAAQDGATSLDRPIYLPSLESGIGANLPAAITTTTTVSGSALPGVSLALQTGTAVTPPAGFAGEVRVVGVSPSRLPSALPGGLQPRAAFLVEPHGATFTPAATLRLPRLDAAGAAPFDAYRVSTTTGQWELAQADVASVDTDTQAFSVTAGTLYAVVPRAGAPTATLTGRVVAGTQPLQGYRAACWNRVSAPTAADGTFQVTDVPTSYGVFLVRTYPAEPGTAFAPEVVVSTSLAPNLGDISVAARPPDLIRPDVVRTSPSDGQGGVARNAQVVVVLSEAVDATHPSPFRVVGLRGEVAGRLTFDNAFTLRLVPTQVLDPAEQYQIVVDPTLQDLAGNRLEGDQVSFRFTTQGGAPAAPPTDTAAFGIAPLTGKRGDEVSILGRNFTGGSVVTFGATRGLVTAESTDEVRALVPDFEPAGDVTIALSAGGTAVPALRPLVLDLRATVAAVFSGASPDVPLAFLDRAAPPPAIVVDGTNVGGTRVTLDGLDVAAVDSVVVVGGVNVAQGRTLSFPAPAPPTVLTGPIVVRGQNGKPGATYRFLLVRE